MIALGKNEICNCHSVLFSPLPSTCPMFLIILICTLSFPEIFLRRFQTRYLEVCFYHSVAKIHICDVERSYKKLYRQQPVRNLPSTRSSASLPHLFTANLYYSKLLYTIKIQVHTINQWHSHERSLLQRTGVFKIFLENSFQLLYFCEN